MGLDITAYKRMKKVGTAESWDEYEDKFDWSTTFYFSGQPNKCYTEKAHGVDENSVYEYEDCFGFYAGSYSGYNQWRNWLSETFIGISAHDVWNNAEKYEESPFYHLVNFSDCEGTIGTEVSANLSIDFAAHQDEVDALDCEEWLKEKYTSWRKAFEMAADGGCINFS